MLKQTAVIVFLLCIALAVQAEGVVTILSPQDQDIFHPGDEIVMSIKLTQKVDKAEGFLVCGLVEYKFPALEQYQGISVLEAGEYSFDTYKIPEVNNVCKLKVEATMTWPQAPESDEIEVNIMPILLEKKIKIHYPLEGQNIAYGERFSIIIELEAEPDVLKTDFFCIDKGIDDSIDIANAPIVEHYVIDDYDPSKKFTTAASIQGECMIQVRGQELTENKKTVLKDYLETVNVNITNEEPPAEKAVFVSRWMADFISGGSIFPVYYTLRPKEKFTGLIVTEKLPEGTEPYESDAIEFQSDSYTYDEETRELKVVVMNSAGITKDYPMIFWLKIDPETPGGTPFEFTEGKWSVLGEEGEVFGENVIKTEGAPLPACPISDQQLLGYIDQWSFMEFSYDEAKNDEAIMQVIEVWENC